MNEAKILAKKIVDMEQYINDSYFKMIIFDLDCFNDNRHNDLLQKKRRIYYNSSYFLVA